VIHLGERYVVLRAGAATADAAYMIAIGLTGEPCPAGYPQRRRYEQELQDISSLTSCDMGAGEVSGSADDRDGVAARTDRIAQATSVAVVAAALVVWWPAFAMGAYGVIFFQQLLSLWAASTAIFLASLTLLAIAVPVGESEPWSRALFYLAIVLTLAGIPFLTALLLRVTIAGYDQIPARRRLVAAAVVATVAVASFGLGQFNNRFLTCSEFIVSGNDTPPGCAQGRGHLGNR
jgi:hypothetical protein